MVVSLEIVYWENDFFGCCMDLPVPSKVADNGPIAPYYLVGDEGFPLANFIMRPFARKANLNIRQQVFNYRLGRARRIVECSFGILVQRFRIFRQPIIADYSTAVKLVQAAVCLHTFILDRQPCKITNDKTIEKTLEKSCTKYFQPNLQGNYESITADSITVRKNLAAFFMHEGSIPWQWNKVRKADY